MSKLARKIVVPIILAGIFIISIFIALNYDQLDLTFYTVILFLAIYTFAFGFATGQSYSSPVVKIVERARELSKGNFSSRVYLQSKDELSELADILNKIAEELEENHVDNKLIEKAVDLKTRARTQVLEDTINALEQKVRNRTAELEKISGQSKSLAEKLKSGEEEINKLKRDTSNLKLKSKIAKAPKKTEEDEIVPPVINTK